MKWIKSIIFIAAIFLTGIPSMAQEDKTYIDEIEEFRNDKDDNFSDPNISPLPDSDIGEFDHLKYYPVDERLRIRAKLNAADRQGAVSLNTVSGKKADFIKYGEVVFNLKGKDYTMDVYRKGNLPEMKDQPEQLFLPYRDMSSGNETSQYGRYVPVKIPDNGNEIYLDFNKSFNPYSEYNSDYDSPLPPQTNTFLQESMMAGERKYEDR